MEEQIMQSTQTAHSHKGPYTTIALSLGAAALLLVVVLALIAKKPSLTQPQEQTMQYQPQRTQQSSVQNQVQQVTPQPIATKQNLDQATQTLDNTDMTQITTGLNQNSQDTSSFTQ